MTFRVEVEQETDGRWIVEVVELCLLHAIPARNRRDVVARTERDRCEPAIAQQDSAMGPVARKEIAAHRRLGDPDTERSQRTAAQQDDAVFVQLHAARRSKTL